MIPTPLLLNESVIRLFVGCCDANGVGRPAWIDVDANNPLKVLGRSSQPLFDIGRPGSFDDNGALPLSVVRLSPTRLYMYYVGFELGVKIRYRLLTGLAISDDNGDTWQRQGDAPILERSAAELYFRCGPQVIKDGDFRMWYIAGSEWTSVNGKDLPVYEVRHMRSADGIHWPVAGETVLAVDQSSASDEHGFGRPWVYQDAQGWHMYYSLRRKSLGAYRIGYASSADGQTWQRHDEAAGLPVSEHGFDDHAIMYAAVIEAGGKTWCFYNGNNFGEAGVGVACRVDA
ncbi:glycosylase [Silvimonas iriomotensis]|uniref:Glycosylase n=2 Tax=Silvimonas iriomotensis TaxID=449662 RepID=A0ABQ2P549_9NEIS|nr:glycosylase [Silvimonas iriomotensis]